jgi:hypothetical protein
MGKNLPRFQGKGDQTHAFKSSLTIGIAARRDLSGSGARHLATRSRLIPARVFGGRGAESQKKMVIVDCDKNFRQGGAI